MENILIKNGKIVTHNKIFSGDIFISEGKIVSVGEVSDNKGFKGREIDASGLLIFPGGVDPHVHMELTAGEVVSSDNFRSGSKAALAGGTTTIIDFVTPSKGESLAKALVERKKAAESSFCDYGLHMSIVSVYEGIRNELKKLVSEDGIISFKMYMAYKDSVGMDDRDILEAMDMVRDAGGISMIHCENGDSADYLGEKLKKERKKTIEFYPRSRPAIVESEAVERAISFSHLTGCPLYIVHISTKDGVDKVLEGKKEGIPVFGETCPHYLLLDDSLYGSGPESARYIMSPPLRKEIDKSALWSALKDGIIETLATDHCPFNNKGENAIDDFSRIPKGVGSIENRLGLLYTFGVLENRITINQFVNMISTKPAKIFGLYPQKGTIMKGADADLVLWDPETEFSISVKDQFQNCDTSVYEGFKLKGKPDIVIAGGKVVFKEGLFDLNNVSGKYLFRKR
ncbi:MAG: dihydropyrimidinase [Acidobacteriota bacterium]